ncbi:Uncharacterized protein BP5553_00353 [Venustampulla echinocandica]|uniref:P-loop containing nucleoside triphosphate hydrolase n=1 Tax=Venustampulla echinocandica TaxID=2656787 RepID=A0A370TXX4_9HELO|nr:Uncharacterized protein BP5553_00353 [Venustampulla echinocandica]RDL40374.1 Uncharacterized protein BP5553_00353 [Venustampulla echinocandica]
MPTIKGSSRFLRGLARQASIPAADIPAFLCPGLLSIPRLQPLKFCCKLSQLSSQQPRRFLNSAAPSLSFTAPVKQEALLAQASLPEQCSGCGAPSQTVLENEPGYYKVTRKSVKEWIQGRKESPEDTIVKASLENAGELAGDLDFEDFSRPKKNVEPPVCDRCHKLKHHETGVSIHHPSIRSIQDTIFESPHKYNHIYHVIDAADFPMSVVPGLHKLLHLTPQRSLNRRSKTGKFYHGRKTEVSFIITRSDLLAPLRVQVDSMMPYLREVLRDTLGRSGKDVRLGNIRCVSAKRSWWVKELKEEIWHRGGGGWMVGKVNVGKSQLFHDVFPKGRQNPITKPRPSEVPSKAPMTLDTLRESFLREDASDPQEESPQTPEQSEGESEWQAPEPLDTSLLLPPAPQEVDYPAMPLVSSLPGTTASPIRLSFGNGKGELIDLPGLSRGDLELHVQQEHRSSLVMRSRVQPEQQVIKPGQSLLLGGFIRIAPTTPDVMILAYSFTPINSHLTSTEKAIGIQTRTRETNVENISLPGTADKIASAGTFHLKWDVTRERSGPLTRNDAVGLKVERLPFRVLATDILIEGCGWVELVAQVRKPRVENIPAQEIAKAEDENAREAGEWLGTAEENGDKEDVHQEVVDPNWPAVEVFTPEGKFVAARRPMNAWLLTASKPVKGKLQGRPRKSMKGMKKVGKSGRKQG